MFLKYFCYKIWYVLYKGIKNGFVLYSYQTYKQIQFSDDGDISKEIYFVLSK